MEAIDSARAAAVRRQAQLSRPGVTLVPRTAPSSSAKGTAGPVDLDVATAAEIEALPYVGPALAARIVADRNARGPFGSLAGLTRVKGVGPSLADKLAVHDIERELYGTSLGVNLDTGVAVDGGHRHHMKAINTITTAGGIRAAVEKGVLTSGVMYECVKHNVPYVLAGSIRDDGPLPDTLMDLIEAQNQYTAALEGVQVVLILSSMLHGIGVGNMLPAWVRIIAVDINPAVVTKLADRGSAQAVGLVTDVGLFLRGLAEQLRASGCDRIFARSPSRNHE
jgi:hypothetical protein